MRDSAVVVMMGKGSTREADAQGAKTHSGALRRAQRESSRRVRQASVRREVGGSPLRAATSCCWRRVLASVSRWFDQETYLKG